MWQTDPCKGKWSILAKSYSAIRDSQGKANAPLEKFLAINGPLIGVIEPAQYLEALSWEVAVDEDGQTVMRRRNGTLSGEQLITNISVNDVIRNSYDKGYFTGDLSKVLLANNGAAMTMVSSVQPTSNAQYSTTGHLEVHDTGFAANTNIEASSSEEATMIVVDDEKRDPTLVTIGDEADGGGSTAGDNDDVPGESNAVAIGETQGRNKAPINDPDISSLSASAFNLDGEYPFNTEFDPDFSGDTFNPFIGNQFNVFDMSDAHWDDFIDFDAGA